MIDMKVVFSEKEITEIKRSAELVQKIIQKGKRKEILKYEISIGWVVSYIEHKTMRKKEQCYFFDLDNEPLLEEVIENICSHLSEEEREVELMKWGLKPIVQADSETFAPFRLLITDPKTGSIEWFKLKGEIFVAQSLEEAYKTKEQIKNKTGRLAQVI